MASVSQVAATEYQVAGMTRPWFELRPHASDTGRLYRLPIEPVICYQPSANHIVPVQGPKEGLFVGCLTSQQQASVSQGLISSDNFTCCHTETEVADPTFYLNQSQYTDTGPTSPSADPITPGAWQGSHWSANF